VILKKRKFFSRFLGTKLTILVIDGYDNVVVDNDKPVRAIPETIDTS
jgi:hypothetical protein